MKNFLYYHHCDYRSYVPYSRVSNEIYMRDGLKAAEINKEINRKSKKRNEKRKEEICQQNLAIKDTRKAINGVKGVWAFADLPYVDISDNICYDPFHVFKNVINYIFGYIEGERQFSNRVRLFCRNTSSHPSLKKISNNSENNDSKSSDSKTKKNSGKKKIDKKQNRREKKEIPIWELKAAQIKNLEKMLNSIVLPTGMFCFSD